MSLDDSSMIALEFLARKMKDGLLSHEEIRDVMAPEMLLMIDEIKRLRKEAAIRGRKIHTHE